MAQIITFSVSEDGKISPSTVQKAGVQGSHNITEVRFNVKEALVSGALEESPTSRIRMQFVDGAGGFYSTGFLDVMSEILPDLSAQYYVTCPIPSTVTNAGGIAKVYLVITEIVYGVEDGPAYEEQVFISSAARISFEGSGVGSPSEYQYRKGISSALVNAEIFVGQAEKYAEESLGYSNTAGEYAGNAADSAADAVTSANNAADSLQELKDGIANGDFKGEPGPQGPQGPQGNKGDKGDKGEKGEPGETPDLSGYATKEDLAEAIGQALEGDY